jgi:hypothetical protein
MRKAAEAQNGEQQAYGHAKAAAVAASLPGKHDEAEERSFLDEDPDTIPF